MKKKLRRYMNKDFKWINYVNKRFSMVDRKGSHSITTRLSTLGICFGVMTLITVLSVMNGFQLQFIDSIIELSSYHVQIKDVKDRSQVEDYLNGNKNVVSYTQFKEAQALMTDNLGREAGSLIRAVPADVLTHDPGFASQIRIVAGEFDIVNENSIVLGARLAKTLDVRVGNEVNLFALSGSSDTALLSSDRTFVVTGIFSCGYADINSTYAFINITDGDRYFGNIQEIFGVKLINQNSDLKIQRDIIKKIPDCSVSVWRDYNRSFFSALRIEKNMLLLLVVMIFIVVAINIFNSMRKLVYERRSEISTLSSLGGSSKSVRNVFVLRGLTIGLKGSVSGMLLALLISFNIKKVFFAISKVQYFFTWLSTSIFNPAMKDMVRENSMWYVYANIPARVFPGEVIFITLFGILSCLFASWIASSNILKLKIAEVLHEQ